MKQELVSKYTPYPQVKISQRTWPDKLIVKAPTWCSVDLRDGNQALIQPMSLEKKMEMFRMLLAVGFKEIEVGFPSASQVEYDFTRRLIEKNLVPEDVTIQVLTQARDHLIQTTFTALKGAREVIVHLYNSTSTLQRKVVFSMNRQQIIELAIEGAKLLKKEEKKYPDTKFRYEYSPESFTGTELEFAVEICEKVMEVLQPSADDPIILNLPATVEMSTPNIYADQIELFCRELKNRDCAIISLHTHNDRGSAVAATELGLLAGGDRVEGTLFGNGERTGNVDIITLALNMFSQGVNPELDFSDIGELVDIYERVSRLPVHPRHPYAGELVYTAFSGSHQDAINKGMHATAEDESEIWQVPYLPIDPTDVGRTYESIIRINSQSGKGGVAYIMEREFGYRLPKAMHPEFGSLVKQVTDREGQELTPQEIFNVFTDSYLNVDTPFKLKSYNVTKRLSEIADGDAISRAEMTALINADGVDKQFSASGNGPLDAFCSGLKEHISGDFTLVQYHEHALEGTSSAAAAAYIQLKQPDGKSCWGVGMDTDIIIASVKAVLNSLNRLYG